MPRNEIVQHGMRRQRDEIAPVVVRHDLHVLRQHVVVELLRLRLDALEHRLRLLAGAHEDDAFDRVVRLVEAELAESRRVSDRDRRDVLHEHRHAVLHREDDVADVFERRRRGRGRARRRTGRPRR